MDYSNLGLDPFLRSVDSLPVKAGTQQSYMDYDWEAITANKARSASLNNLKGGTLTLGGTNNGDGVLKINLSSGTKAIDINSGSMVIYDSSGKTQMSFVYSESLMTINDLRLGGTDPTQSFALNFYDSGTNHVGVFGVDEFVIYKGLRLGGTELANSNSTRYLELWGTDTTNPVGTPTANYCRIYVDNGGASGKNRVMAQFDSGAPVLITTEP